MRHQALLLFACALIFGIVAVAMTYRVLSLRSAPTVQIAVPPPPAPTRSTLSSMIGGEHRAITIRVNDVLGVGGFILPGDRVDVLLTRTDNSSAPATDVLLQNVRVLGIDQEASDKKDKPMVARAVTLEVSPEEGQRITLGTQVGTLSLALRNADDTAAQHTRSVGLADLRPAIPPAAPHYRHGKGSAVRVLRGIEAADIQIVHEP